eukprot:CAMPEP_0204528556 /NCGR_PEP_ID=MMETSP0661-20131031/9591_1 /ASSEMBLY_ACC=CAM_ASM_000606 /TAXON_ID=109239 /ORGANISM="Alexandrium margalefi, Strain AMGDE01CS-322" /LENGTH=535 /DNA_ID=CAMNT_0051534537 /DNA_START=22 /DNA_END=1626 /DNA_ORIENTATION=-
MTNKLSVGMRLHAMYADGQYYPAEVVAISESTRRASAPVKIHYRDYDSTQDAWLALESLRSKALPLAPGAKAATRTRRRAGAAALTVDPMQLTMGTRLQARGDDGIWYAARVVAVSTNQGRTDAPVKVNYLGYTADSDEWVGADRLRSRALRAAAGRLPRRRGVDTHVTAMFCFTVPEGKMDEFKAGFKDFYAAVKAGTRGCLYYGFATCGNQVYCRQGFSDGDSYLTHREEVKAILEKAVAVVGKDGLQVSVVGPAAEVAKLKPELGSDGVTFWELDGRSKWYGKKGGVPGQPDTHVSVTPRFTLAEGKLEEFRGGFPDFYRAVWAGTRGCLYFGFAVSGNEVLSREGYKDAECCLTHLNDVKEQLDKAVAAAGEGGLKVDVMGPAGELEKLKAAMDPMGAAYWELDEGTFGAEQPRAFCAISDVREDFSSCWFLDVPASRTVLAVNSLAPQRVEPRSRARVSFVSVCSHSPPTDLGVGALTHVGTGEQERACRELARSSLCGAVGSCPGILQQCSPPAPAPQTLASARGSVPS